MTAQYVNALKPLHAFKSKGAGAGIGDGISPYAARYDDARLAALSGVAVQASPVAIKPTANMTAITAHTQATAVGAVFADLAAARTAVNTLRTDVETALSLTDGSITTLRSDAEARLDAIETKIDLIISKLTTAGVFS
ncbi:MAG: hypothetical protein ACOYB2_10495 [Limnohabitans sp.]